MIGKPVIMMNYNVKRLSNPLKGRCKHNQEILDTIDIVTDDSPGLCPFNKGYLLRRLGQAMDIANDNCNCVRRVDVEVKEFKDGDDLKIYNSVIDEYGGLIILTDTEGTIRYVSIVLPNLTGEKRADMNAYVYSRYFTKVPLTLRIMERIEADLKSKRLEITPAQNYADTYEEGFMSASYDGVLYLYRFPANDSEE